MGVCFFGVGGVFFGGVDEDEQVKCFAKIMQCIDLNQEII